MGNAGTGARIEDDDESSSPWWVPVLITVLVLGAVCCTIAALILARRGASSPPQHKPFEPLRSSDSDHRSPLTSSEHSRSSSTRWGPGHGRNAPPPQAHPRPAAPHLIPSSYHSRSPI